MRFKFTLEKGSKKFTCPNCGVKNKYRRIIDNETGDYAPFEFGRCDRENSCGYFRKPEIKSERTGRYKNAKKSGISQQGLNNKNAVQAVYERRNAPDFIEAKHFLDSLANYE